MVSGQRVVSEHSLVGILLQMMPGHQIEASFSFVGKRKYPNFANLIRSNGKMRNFDF